MKIFIFTTVFSPSVGGIERLVEMLARGFMAAGHELRLATLTPGCDCLPFEVVRQPTWRQFAEMLRWCDIHLQANVSAKYAWARFLVPERMVYQHNGPYEADDGFVSWRERAKRRIAAATPGIAVSQFVAQELGVRHVVPNCYDDKIFRDVTPWRARDRDIVFLGRLVSQKGCDVLIRALGDLARSGLRPTLSVIGDGPERSRLEALAYEEGVVEQVNFEGMKTGQDLATLLNRHRIQVVPSRCREAFGIVALEGLACGCLPIVSERGGLREAVGPFGLQVPNGDAKALAHLIRETLNNPGASHRLLEGVEAHLSNFKPDLMVAGYLSIFESVTAS